MRDVSGEPTLYGREHECALLEELLAEARRSHGRALLLRGEAGAGKSALLRHASSLSSGMLTLHATGTDSESGLAFAGLNQLLWPLRELVDRLPRSHAAALHGVLRLRPESPGTTDDRLAVSSGLVSLLTAAAETQPLLCLVDDAHRLDTDSVHALAFAARRLQSAPVAFLFAATEALTGTGLPEASLAPLDRAAAAKVAGGRLPPLTREAALDAARGNPASLVQLSFPLVLHRRAIAALAGGRFPAAGELAGAGLRAATEAGEPELACHHRAILAWVAALGGDARACTDHAREVFAAASPRGLALPGQLATVALGELELGLGRHEEALAHLTRVWESTASRPEVRLFVGAGVVEAAVRADRRELALCVASEYERLGAPPALVARCLALLGEADGFETAIGLHLESGAAFDCARTRLLYGEALRRARRRREARTQLHAARGTFEELGAASWARRAANELRGSGVTATRGKPGRLDELTAQETQIARLVAAGATNKQVAAQLVLSPRTIDFHLRNVFAKLGITSRIQLNWFELGGDEGTGDFAGATRRRAA